MAAQIGRIGASLEAWRHWRQYISLVLSTAASFPNRALACPDCAVGREARQLFLQDEASLYVAAIVVPFALMIVISVWAERSARHPKRGPRKEVAHER